MDFALLARRGVRGLLIDVDNTLVAPRGQAMPPDSLKRLLTLLHDSEIERWALASNSRRDLITLASSLRAEIVKATLLVAKPRIAYFRRALDLLGMAPGEVAMIGDKVIHDIAPASRLGIQTVLVEPFAPDHVVDRLMLRRARERHIRPIVQRAAVKMCAPRSPSALHRVESEGVKIS